MDDRRIITVALALVNLIKESTKIKKPKKPLKFLITTHHALFFNVLFKSHMKKKCYILSKSDAEFLLKEQRKDAPFAYHHMEISEIAKINQDDIKKYHFNIFRAILEKTANFLGHDNWKKCLQNKENQYSSHSETFIKTIDHYSHDKLSDLEYRDVTEDEQKEFKDVFDFFIKKYNFELEEQEKQSE